jgi:lysophospholipase L1-like esterase
MRRWLKSRVIRVTVVLVIVVFAVGATALSVHSNSPANASGSDATAAPSAGFYLDVGASTSLGFQPTGIPAHNGKRTSTGYANDLVAYEAKRGIQLFLRQVGCPGETTLTMLTTTDHCYIPPGRQLWAAEKYLKKEGTASGLVTIDLGFNDVRACLLPAQVEAACAAKGLKDVRDDLPKIVADLKAAAGPNVHFIGLDYGDPFLAHYLLGTAEFDDATDSLTVMTTLDNELHSAYTNADIPTANVAGAFRLANTTPTDLAKVGMVPQNVASECAYTWMCTPPPWGPDDHPNNAGYAVIATEIEADLPSAWKK